MKEKLIRNEQEAIETIKSNMPTSGYYMLRESLEMAIKALEEVQKYHKLEEQLKEAYGDCEGLLAVATEIIKRATEIIKRKQES